MNLFNQFNEDVKPNDLGYKLFFTFQEEQMVPMRYARAIQNRNNLNSDPMAIGNMKYDYFAGPMHFGGSVEEKEGYKFFDVDLRSAYPTWLINYKRGNFKYKIGGNKRYHYGNSFFRFNTEGLRVYKIRFAVKTNGKEKSRIYRRYLLKTTKIKDMIITDKYISGIINIPDIDNLVNRFLDDVQGYSEYDVVIDSIIVATGNNFVNINEENISKAMLIKNNPNHPYNKYMKEVLNSSTGYLSIMDKVMYYAMVNQVRMELFKLLDAVDRWNAKRPDLPISDVAANTDGITFYAPAAAEYALEDIIEHQLNPYSVFTFVLKDVYSHAHAHFTKNDIRRKAVN